MEILNIASYREQNISELSKLSAYISSGVTTITVENGSNFSADEYIAIGNPGYEQSEILKITSVTAQSIVVPTTRFSHKDGERVTQIRGNQIKVYESPNVDNSPPADSTFTTVTATIDIKSDATFIETIDSDGGSEVWYKWTYYNSTTLSETGKDLTEAFRGGMFLFSTTEQIRQETGMRDNQYITDDTIRTRREDAESEILGALSTAGYSLPLSSVPKVIRNVSRILTAGLILEQDYGMIQDGTNKEGVAKKKEARDLLDRIINKTIALVGDDMATILPVTSNDVLGWPDSTTADATEENAGGDYKFRSLTEY